MAAIRCRGLTKRYGTRTVVDGLDLEVDAGEVFGFLGPNGAGKTTTIRMLLGLVGIDAGAAWLLGDRVPCPQRLAAVGAMVEEPAFYPWMTGRRNLEVLAAEGAAVTATAVAEALERTGLAAAGGGKVRTYSQGMRQRLGLAAAILRRPEVVLLDEPANGLDPAGIHDLRVLLRQLADEGSAVFLSSHLLGEVEQVCHRVALVDRGRLVSVGAVDTLAGGSERVEVRVTPAETATARAALSRWTVTSATAGVLQVAGDGARGTQVNHTLAAAGIFAEAVTTRRLSLEEWFLAHTEVGDAATGS